MIRALTNNCFPSIRFTFNKTPKSDVADKGEKDQDGTVEDGKQVSKLKIFPVDSEFFPVGSVVFPGIHGTELIQNVPKPCLK